MLATVTETKPVQRAAQPVAVAARADGVGLLLDGRRVLSGIDLEIPAGASVAVLGANGAGKSSLLRLLATLWRASEGRLTVLGEDAARARPTLRARLGLVAHQPMLYRDLSIVENLEFFARLYAVPGPRARAEEVMDQLGLARRSGEPVRRLSRGLQQRAAVARALLHRPALLLADEPFSGLDAASTAALEALFADLVGSGMTLVTAGHDTEQSLRISSRVVVLRGGRVSLDAPSCFTDAARLAAAAGGNS